MKQARNEGFEEKNILTKYVNAKYGF